MTFFDKIRRGLKKTRDNIGSVLGGVFSGGRRADAELLAELEDALILADLGVDCTGRVMGELRGRIKDGKISDGEGVRAALKEILKSKIGVPVEEDPKGGKPHIILVVGVNGVGKTTTIGKLAGIFAAEGKSVLLAAGDTFRAAAADQLEIWAERAGAQIVRQREGADPAAVIFDTIRAGTARDTDVIICDTAGRLHNKANLMNELAKINRIIARELPGSKKDVFLVIDATTGQNALAQTAEFKNAAELTGIVLTKLDGTARGGMAVALADNYGIPIRYVGVGEQMDDLLPFDPEAYVGALFD